MAVRWWGESEFGSFIRRVGFVVLEHMPFTLFDGEKPLSQFVIASKGLRAGAASGPVTQPPDPPLSSIHVDSTRTKGLVLFHNHMRRVRGLKPLFRFSES